MTSLQYLFMGSVFVLALMAIWLPFVDRNTGTFVVVVVNIVGAGFLAVVSGAAIRTCRTEIN